MEESVLLKNGYEWDDSEEWWVREWTTNNGADTILEAYLLTHPEYIRDHVDDISDVDVVFNPFA